MEEQDQLQALQSEINQKEQKIIKLKGLLTRSMRSDKRREQQIESLQIDLSDRELQLESFNKELENNRAVIQKQTEKIALLEEELNELTNRLNTGVGNEAAQKHNERIKKMLEKSNTLYAELQSKYQKLSMDFEEEKKKNLRVGKPQKVIVLNDDYRITLNDDGTYVVNKKVKDLPSGIEVYDFRKNNKKQQAEQNFLKGYLKRVVLEFFINDISTQQKLIPVILQLLDCPEEQILAAQRSYVEGHQIISKSVFGK